MALLTHLKKSMVEGEQLLWVTVPCWDGASVPGCVCGDGGRVKGGGGGDMLQNEFCLFVRELRTLISSVKSGLHCLHCRLSLQSFFSSFPI